MNIVIATGGSGGHIIPALRVADELRRHQCSIRFLGAFNLWKKSIEDAGFLYDELRVRGLELYRPHRLAHALFLLMRATWVSLGLLKKYNVDAVAGFGGYGAFPVVLAGICSGRPTLIHEQNVIPGRANSILSRWVERITISFPQSRKFFNNQRKIIFTGCPSHVPSVAVDHSALLQKFHLEKEKKTIVVLGGSQGSHRINEVFVQTVRELKKKVDIQVIHLCGKSDYGTLKNQYATLAIPFALFDFFDKMEHIYPLADIVIGRAGAVSVTELIHFRRPSILIPYPYAFGHQRYNAQVLTQAGVGRFIEERNFCHEWLLDAIKEMLAKPPGLEQWDQHFNEILGHDASSQLAQAIMGLKRCI